MIASNLAGLNRLVSHDYTGFVNIYVDDDDENMETVGKVIYDTFVIVIDVMKGTPYCHVLSPIGPGYVFRQHLRSP